MRVSAFDSSPSTVFGAEARFAGAGFTTGSRLGSRPGSPTDSHESPSRPHFWGLHLLVAFLEPRLICRGPCGEGVQYESFSTRINRIGCAVLRSQGRSLSRLRPGKLPQACQANNALLHAPCQGPVSHFPLHRVFLKHNRANNGSREFLVLQRLLAGGSCMPLLRGIPCNSCSTARPGLVWGCRGKLRGGSIKDG